MEDEVDWLALKSLLEGSIEDRDLADFESFIDSLEPPKRSAPRGVPPKRGASTAR